MFLLILPPLLCLNPGAAPGSTYPVDCTDGKQTRRLRHELVKNHIRRVPGEARQIEDTRVFEAIRTVPRHAFVRPDYRSRAYLNKPLPIGHGQTISQPYVVALMSDLVEPDSGDRALEIGTGSGYQAAVLAELVGEVYSVEIIEPLARQAKTALEACGYENVTTRTDDGYYGWQDHAPYDVIVVTAAASHISPHLVDQLAPRGRMVVPVGPPFQVQRLMLIEKNAGGELTRRSIMPVRFVPLVREDE